MTDLVVISLEGWDGVWRRNQHLIWRMLQADPTLRVLFVEPAADPASRRCDRAAVLVSGVPPTSESAGRLWTMRPLKLLPRASRTRDESIAVRSPGRPRAREWRTRSCGSTIPAARNRRRRVARRCTT